MAEPITEWVMSCQECIRESRIDRTFTHLPLLSPHEHNTAPEDAKQIYFGPELASSGGYENIVTAVDVFTLYLFAYATYNQDAKTAVELIINIMTKGAYLPTPLISDKGSALVSHVIKEVTVVLGITHKQATTKHAQTIGLLEGSHASIKEPLKVETDERRSFWHKYVSIAVLNYNTYHASMAVSHTEFFMDVFLATSWI